MIQIPNLPNKEELEFKEKNFILALREQISALRKEWVYTLLAVLILAIPAGFGIRYLISNQLINSYVPPRVNTDLYNPQDLEVVDTGLIPVVRGVYSAYAQVVNPNPALAAWVVEYKFNISDAAGQQLFESSGSSYIDRGKSRFIVMPRIELDTAPANINLEIENIRWTGQAPDIDLDFDVLQQNSGVTEEGNFFVEAEVRNRQDFKLKKVNIDILVFDQSNSTINAVNVTTVTDLEAFESRYFRVLWPDPLSGTGQIEINPSVNPLDTGAVINKPDQIPSR